MTLDIGSIYGYSIGEHVLKLYQDNGKENGNYYIIIGGYWPPSSPSITNSLSPPDRAS